MSTLSQFLGGAGSVKSIQYGTVGWTMVISDGAGAERKYVDITISSVNSAKCIVNIYGGFGPSEDDMWYSGGGRKTLGRVTSSTNLRVSTGGITYVNGCAFSWQVVEFA